VAKGAGGAGRRREGARATRSVRLRAGLAAGTFAPNQRVDLGRCPTVACVVRSTARVHGFRGLEPGAGVRLRALQREDRVPGDGCDTGSARAAYVAARNRTQGLPGASSEGEESPGEHGPGVLALARVGIVARTGLPGGARLRSGRGGRSPASHGVNETEGRGRRVKARTTGPPSGSKEPSSRPLRPASPHGRAEAKGRRGGESDRELSGTSRRPQPKCEPARKQRPARAGTAPRKVKALKGSSRDASGMKQGREASGASRRAAGSGQELERAVRQPDPSRGARTLRTVPVRERHPSPSAKASRRRRGDRGTRRKAFVGASHHERRTPRSGQGQVAQAS